MNEFPYNMPYPLQLYIKSWGRYYVSPYSESYYKLAGQSWTHTPIGQTRVSDHWNFYAQGYLHAPTDKKIPPDTWAVGIWDGKMYRIKYIVKKYEPQSPVYKPIKEVKKSYQIDRAYKKTCIDTFYYFKIGKIIAEVRKGIYRGKGKYTKKIGEETYIGKVTKVTPTMVTILTNDNQRITGKYFSIIAPPFLKFQGHFLYKLLKEGQKISSARF